MNDKMAIMDPDAVEGIYREGWSDGADFDGDFAKTADDQTAAATEAWEASRARQMYASNRPRTEPVPEHGDSKPSAGPWEAHDDDGTGTLPCVLSEHVNPSGTFYIGQFNRFADAVLCAKALRMAKALEIISRWNPEASPSEPDGLSIIEAIDIAKAALAGGAR